MKGFHRWANHTLNRLRFKGSFVLVLLFLVGAFLRFLTSQVNFPAILSDLLVVLSDAFVTAAVLDILLSFSNQEELICGIADGLRTYIGNLFGNKFFAGQLSGAAACLESLRISEDSDLTKEQLQETLRDYSTVLAKYAFKCTDPLVYFDAYKRTVTLSKGSEAGLVKVFTHTDMTYVNLSDQDYEDTYNPQFLRFDGSGPSYHIVSLSVNGREISDKEKSAINNAALQPESHDSFYESGKKYTATIPKGQITRIIMEAQHEMPISAFYQARTLDIPCRKFDLRANLDNSLFPAGNESSYIFRWTFFENKVNDQSTGHKTPESVTEVRNETVHLCGEYMKPGNGYALTLARLENQAIM